MSTGDSEGWRAAGVRWGAGPAASIGPGGGDLARIGQAHGARGTPGCDVLLLAAFHPELAPLRPALGEALRGQVGGRHVVAAVVGIGATLAAAGAAMRLMEEAPRAVVLLGTCGAYAGRGLAVGDVAVASRVRLTCPGVVHGIGQFPEPMSILTECHPSLVEALLAHGGKAVPVAATLAITTDDAAAARIQHATQCSAEHLEAHGVAAACAARGVPFAAALGVANRVGSRAREEWKTHHRAAASAAVDLVLRWLTAAPGP